MAKVLFVVANEGYESIEFSTPKTLLEKQGYQIAVASPNGGKAVSNKDEEITTQNIKNVLPEDYIAVCWGQDHPQL